MQNFTSANTSINKGKLPAIYGKLDKLGKLNRTEVLDFGCGRYTDHIREYLMDKNTLYFPYDPYNQPDDVNHRTRQQAVKPFAIAVCSNVLNVIDDDAQIMQIIEDLHTAAREAWFTVYEGDRTGKGRQTGPDMYQRNLKLAAYLEFFHRCGYAAEIKSGMIHMTR